MTISFKHVLIFVMLSNLFIFAIMAGTDIAGEVVDVGPAVTKFKKGDKVVAMLGTLVYNISPFMLYLVTSTNHQ